MTIRVRVQSNHLGYAPGEVAHVDPTDKLVRAALAGNHFVPEPDDDEVLDPELVSDDDTSGGALDGVLDALKAQGVAFTDAQLAQLTELTEDDDVAGALALIDTEVRVQLGGELADEVLAPLVVEFTEPPEQ